MAGDDDDDGGNVDRNYRLKVWDLGIKTLGGLVVLIGGYLGYLEYLSRETQFQTDQKERVEANKKREDDQADLRQREFRLKLYEEQRPLYHEACNVAAKVATAHDDEAAQQRFWQLYYGELCLVEDKRVEAAMMEYGDALKGKRFDQLPLLSLKLAVACKTALDLANVFDVELADEEGKIKSLEEAKIKKD